MLFKVFAKNELPKLFGLLAANPVIAPVQKGLDQHGAPLFDFDLVSTFDDLRLDYTSTVHSAKRYFLPSAETLATFVVDQDGWKKQVNLNVSSPQVFFGMHPCDINALNKLDKVLVQSAYPNPFYATKRRNMFIIGQQCATPGPQCFCRSMGTDSALHGFDMFLTDLGESYFAEILSAAAFQFLSQIGTREPDHDEHDCYKALVAKKNALFKAKVDCSDLTKILDMEFESAAWKTWGDKCLSCGTCANVCPTCYCYGVEETVHLNLRGAVKTRHLHSCNLIDFAVVAGGHNFRPHSDSRLKYRYYHKHRGFVEAFEEPLCVGCGRCGESCLSGITVPAVIASVREGE